MVVMDQDLTTVSAPYKVYYPFSNKSSYRDEVDPWLEENGTGKYAIALRHKVIDDRRMYGYVFHFTDEDTAFWFRMRFGE